MNVPSDEEFLIEIGVEPKHVGGDGVVRQVEYRYSPGVAVSLTYDAIGASIRIVCDATDSVRLDVYREFAKSMSIYSAPGVFGVDISFESEDIRSRIRLQLHPVVTIHDEMLQY